MYNVYIYGFIEDNSIIKIKSSFSAKKTKLIILYLKQIDAEKVVTIKTNHTTITIKFRRNYMLQKEK